MVRRASIVFGLAALVAVALASASSGQSPGPGAGPPGGSPPGLDKAIAAKEKHAERLLDTPGIAGIGVGVNPAGKPVIRIYKEKSDVAGLPDALEGIPVQSLTTGILQPRAPTDRFPRPVPIGVSSGHYSTATGTLGVRVTDGTNVYALSNNHVFAAINSASIGDPILQPGPIEDGGALPDDQIGTLHDYETIDFAGNPNTMDAAVALVSTGTVGTSTPPDGYGTPSPVTAPASIGQAVQKYGRTTGHQLGAVAETNVTVDVCYFLIFDICLQEAQFVNQISVSPGTFSAPGDSGSLIVTQGGNQPVALLFAGGDGLTIGSPIDAVLQRFGVTIDGSTPPDGPPGAPTSLSASPGDASASLSWSAPSFDGGSPLTGYKVYRGTSPNPTTEVAQLGVQTSYTDTGLANGTTYYYKVSALNANGEGPLSNQAQVTPIAFVPPSEPLPTLDDFNRGFENPLSDAGRWSNGVSGGEAGLYVPSVWLACSIATTCTAWRNNAQYGPDSEVWARLSVLPGDSNQLRLYARLQQPGTATFDSYMLRTTQLPGTDQVSLERVDNGTIVTLLTVNQELVAGDVLLLRVTGSTLEAWRNGGSWSRLGVVTDSTYGGGGYVGVGLRGTTGRADDFGARTMGAPPPDTEPPGPPGTLTATPASATQIDLAWGAASDNASVVQYRIERCEGAGCSTFTEIATTTALSYPDSGLTPSTSYSYRVRAEDAVPLLGPYSNVASASTPAPPDTEPPGPPGTLTATPASATQIDLAWGAASDNASVVQYRIERCEGAGCSTFTEIATTTALSYPDSGLTPSTSYSYRVRAEDAVPLLGPYSNVASASTQASPKPMYFSLQANGTVGGVSVANEDVVFFDGAATFSLAFDGSDVGLSSGRLDAFGWLDADSLLFSLDTDGASLPGVAGTVDDSDIIRFDASSLGSTTAGTFSMYFDGSDVGLTTNAEDVDAFELLANGNLLLSTGGASSVAGVSGADEDLLSFTPATLGPTTSGTFVLHFDGSDVGLTLSGEDVDAVAVDGAGRIHLSTRDNFAVAGVSGADEDVFVFDPSTLGTTTAGAFGPSLYFDGSAFGLAGNDVYAIDLPPGA
ncbi:MAG TPA: fibronectin type III domain-containing protein [Gaiellaceae bacterium]|nr:fibronectin type III domain-containing protein [Gaiellaceae bacterium]